MPSPSLSVLVPWSMASPNCTKDAFMQPASSSSAESSDLAKILPKIEWTKSDSTYSSCNEARTANSMLATMFVFASSVVRETEVPFSVFMSHPMLLFTVMIGIRQTE